MINQLPNRRVISIERKLQTVGSEPLHVICDDYEDYLVKNNHLIVPAYTLINEVICHYFLKLWNISTPEIALINLESATMKKDFGSRHKISYYERLAFGSKVMGGTIDASEFLESTKKVDYNKLYQPIEFARIGLFDMWVENDDRPPDLKNLMLYETEKGYRFLAIDNAMAFRTGAYDTLADSSFLSTEHNYCLQSTFFKKIRQHLKADIGTLLDEKENFYHCTASCHQYFDDIAQLIPKEWGLNENIKSLIYNFLFNKQRNEAVFEDFLRMWQ